MYPKKTFLIGSPILSFLLVFLITFAGVKTLTHSYQELPGEEVPIMPARKIAAGKKHPPYLTNPPTSGWYTESDIRDGVFSNPLKDEQIVYALSNGKVAINYNCFYSAFSPTPQLSPIPEATFSDQPKRQSSQDMQTVWQQVEQQNKKCGNIISGLRQIVDERGAKDLILAPKSNLDTRIALSAWGRFDKMLWIDKERIIRFINAYRGQKPKI